MSLFFRRLFFYFLVFLFFILSPLVIGYTAGYRYDFKQHKILKVGAIFTESDPKNANILLNGKKLKEITPARLYNISPGEYELEIYKENYFPWKKKIFVQSSEVNFINNIFLFKKSSPSLLTLNVSDFLLNDQTKEIIFLRQEQYLKEFWKIKFENNLLGTLTFQNPVLIWRGELPGQKIQLIKWLVKNEKILFRNETDFFFLDLADKTHSPKIELISQKKIQELRPASKTNFLLALTPQHDLYWFNLENQTFDFLNDQVIDFAQNFNQIVLLVKNKKGALLKTKNNQTKDLLQLPHENFSLQESFGSLFVIADQKENEILVLKENGEVQEKIPGYKAFWIKKEKPLLLVYNDYEIWLYSPEKNEKTLLARLSEKINKIEIHPSLQAILVQTNDTLKALELSNQPPINIFNLASGQDFTKSILDENGKRIFFVGRLLNEDQPNLYYLEIH